MKISLFAGLTVGNIVAWLFGITDFDAAFERSFFQGIALFALWICERIKK